MFRNFKLLLILCTLLSIQESRATSYTHRLNYNHDDNANTSTLSAEVTFEDTAGIAQTNQSFDSLDTNFITSITFTYNPAGGTTQTLTSTDLRFFHITHAGTTNYGGTPSLESQLNDINFTTFDSAGFSLSRTGNKTINAGGVNDFSLASSTYLSPAPLPLLGLFTSISFFKKLKNKYKSKYNL